MTDEEKKAIDNMKSLLLYSKEHEYFSPFQEQEIDDMNIVLNLIEKQSKEIEELNKDLKKKPIFLIKDIYSPKLKEISLQDVEGLIEQGREEVKDKIKAKIDEVCESTIEESNVDILYSLLEKE